MNDYEKLAGEALSALVNQTNDREAAIDALYVHLRDNGRGLSRVTIHKYMCKRGCQIATVFRAGGLVLCAVRDFKFSPGMNEQFSVPAAREKNTLDGQRHWPGHVYDVEQLARGGPKAGMGMNCRHRHGTISAADILATVAGVHPGNRGAPTRL